MTSVVIYSIGIMIVLDLIGIEIGPLLAGLGIGGLAVALALQDTLSNFFAGMYMITDKPIEKGNYISFDGYEGYVEEISWRNTKIRSWDNNLIILPNSKLSQTTLVNYSKPNKTVTRILKIGVSYDSDPDKIVKVLEKTVKDTLKSTDAGDSNTVPIVKFSDFKDSAIEFKLIYGVTDYTKRFSFEDELKLNILKEFKKNNIEIPYPIQTIYLKEKVRKNKR
jgi:small-conductance mechanosensitive channel